jgi:hypothetical protein
MTPEFKLDAAVNVPGADALAASVSRQILAHADQSGGRFHFSETWDDGYSQMLATPMRRVDWYVDGREVSTTTVNTYAWPLAAGTHEVYSRVWDEKSADAHMTGVVRFYVH